MTSAWAWPRSPRAIRGRRTWTADIEYFVAQVPGGRRLRDHPDVLLRGGLPAAAGPGRGRAAATCRSSPGIMPITSVATIERIVVLSGARFPESLAERLHADAGDGAAVRKIGVEYAAGMCERLLAEGVPGLHFYTLNGSRATQEIYELLGLGDRGRAQARRAGAAPAAVAGRSGSSAPMTAYGRRAGKGVAGQQVGEAQAAVETAGRRVGVLRGQHRRALQAALRSARAPGSGRCPGAGSPGARAPRRSRASRPARRRRPRPPARGDARPRPRRATTGRGRRGTP